MTLFDKYKTNFKWAIVADKPLEANIKHSFDRYYRRRVPDSGRGLVDDPRIFASADEALAKSCDNGYEYLLLNWEGLLIPDQPKFYFNALKFLDSVNKTDNWLVCGQIIDDTSSFKFWNPGKDTNKWYYLWPITCLINLKKWNELGRPEFGSVTSMNLKQLPAVTRSGENIHDSYTPLWIKRSDGENLDSITEVKFGWNMLRVSLDNNLVAHNISAELRSSQIYTYPENDIDRYNKTMQHLQSANFLNLDANLLHHMDNMAHRGAGFNPFNSEPLADTMEFHNYQDNYADIDTVVNTCQGFKDFVFTFSKLCKNQHTVKFIHYDIAPNVVNARQRFIETWDGSLESLVQNNLVNPNENYTASYNNLLEYFDSKEHLLEQWAKYKQCEHYFVVQNLFHESDQKQIKNLMKSINARNVIFFYSDIFPWEHNYLIYGFDNLKKIQAKLLQHLKTDINLLITESKGVEDHHPMFHII